MFEDSFVAVRVEGSAAGRRWLLAGSVLVQVVAVGLVIALPMLHPERLVTRVSAPVVFLPVKPVLPPRAVARQEVSRSASAMAVPEMTRVLHAPGRIPRGVTPEDAPEVGMVGVFSGVGMRGSGMPGVMGEGAGSEVNVVVAAAPVKKVVRISAGVTAGLLAEPIRPVYPAIAKAARVEGDVVVAATISPEGRIEGMRVVRGPEMLRGAAMEAIGRARYRPFLLNGVATAVETTVTVVFRIGG